MKTLAYLRVSKDTQDVNNQRLAILDFARTHRITVDDFVEISVSSRRTTKERRIDELLERLSEGDTLMVAEISRMGRSVGQIISTVDALIRKRVRFIAVKEGIDLAGNGEQDINSKVMITMFGLFAEIERDLISMRTKEGLAAAKAAGKQLGRPKGALGKSKLDGKEEEIAHFLGLGVSKASIAKITGVDRSTLYHFIKTRGIGEKRGGSA